MLPSLDVKLDDILKEGVANKATDIHICTGAPPKMRIYGSLKPMTYNHSGREMRFPDLTDMVAEDLIKPMMDAQARRTYESSGNWDMSYDIFGISRFRVNIFRQKGAIAAVFRALPTKILHAEDLGLPSAFFELTSKRRGMILVTGATGSGKSTTLAAFVDIINRTMPKHIITLEDPIEYEHWHSESNISQREIGDDVSTFDAGLRAALREDPDVILVGEMRDQETMEIALRAAETGHLLLSTLHTIGAVETVNRVVDSFPESRHRQIRNQIASIMEAVISQQLLPKKDGNGYVVAFEILYKNKEVQHMIREDDIEALENYMRTPEARAEGMKTMDDSIMELYRDGKITRDIAIAYSVDKRAMENKLHYA